MIPGLCSLFYKVSSGGTGSFAGSAAPPFVSGMADVGSTASSNATTAVPLGGTGPYTYSWTQTTGDSSIQIDTPTLATTTFSVQIYSPFDSTSGTYVCTITDSLSAFGLTNYVTANLSANPA